MAVASNKEAPTRAEGRGKGREEGKLEEGKRRMGD